MSKKSNAKQQSRKDSYTASRRQLARHLSGIVKHPLTPFPLYLHLVDTLAGYISLTDWESPELIDIGLREYAKQKRGNLAPRNIRRRGGKR